MSDHTADRTPLLVAESLGKRFPKTPGQRGRGEWTTAVCDVDLSIAPGECLALVGESGAGKTTIAQMLLRLLEPTSGDVRLQGESLLRMSSRRLRERRRLIQMVFQDPLSSLNSRLRVGAVLGEAIAAHWRESSAERRIRVVELLERVGLDAAIADRLPAELSGGECQRVALARALATEPKVLIADEPVASLDTSVRAQILNLLADLQRRLGLALLLIAHDLALVETMADRVAVLYRGRIVELAPTARLFANPQHPYTARLLASTPTGDPRRRAELAGPPAEVSTPEAAVGCAYGPRCPISTAECRSRPPELREIEREARVACHHPIGAIGCPQDVESRETFARGERNGDKDGAEAAP